MLNLGYACINNRLRKKGIFTNRGATRATLDRKGVIWAVDLYHQNLEDLYKVIQWNIENDIHLFRISSCLAPHATDPHFIKKPFLQSTDPTEAFAYPLEAPILKRIGQLARKGGVRLTFHPGQYNSLSSDDPTILANTQRDLLMHAYILDLMGCGPESVMVIHGGGTYGHKESTMKQFANNFAKLPVMIRNRIVLENDEKSYGIDDILKLSQMLVPSGGKAPYGVPVVFDIFHHICYRQRNPGERDFIPVVEDVVKSWRVVPKFHFSRQKPGGRLGAHSHLVRHLPVWFLEWCRGKNIDVMIESKAKEQSVLLTRS